MSSLVQVVLVDALSRLVIDSTRCADYAAEVAARRLADRYGVRRPLALTGETTEEGFAWIVAGRKPIVLPGLYHLGGERFTERPPKHPRLPDWAHVLPMELRRMARRIGRGDTTLGLIKMLKGEGV